MKEDRYHGYREHHCDGSLLLRPKLHRRAEYFGFELGVLQTMGSSAPIYLLRPMAGGETVKQGQAFEISELLAQWEGNEVALMLDEMNQKAQLYEHVDELGARVGFSLYGTDREVRTGAEMLHHLKTREQK